jgi:anti-anti-sigma regulatory factor
VDCWIGVDREGSRRIVRLAGRLTDAEVPELLRACAETRSLDLDLSDLVSADCAGIDAIRRIRLAGASLVGTQGYIQIKLDTPSAGAGLT